MQNIYRSYEFFDDFFKFAFGIFLGYFENILKINNDQGCIIGFFQFEFTHQWIWIFSYHII